MNIRTVISRFVEEKGLDCSVEELFREYESFKASYLGKTFGKFGGRPQKYSSKEERDQARRDGQNKRYQEKKLEKD